MKKFLALGVVGLLASSANAGFSTGPYNDVQSNGTNAQAIMPSIVYNHAGPAFTPGSFTVQGDLTEINTGTYASEARFNVTSPGGQQYASAAHIATTNYTGSINVPANTQSFTAAFPSNGPGNSVGNWSFRPFESFDDGGNASVDQEWDNLILSVDDFVAPAIPTHTDLGNLVFNESSKAQGHIATSEIDWYAITLTGPGGLRVTTAKTFAIGADRHPDTELGVYNSNGFLLGNNDDIAFPANPYSLVSLSNLPAGTYYIAVGGFNTAFGVAGFGVTSTATTSGQYWLNVAPEPASLALLGLGALAVVRRRR